MENQTPHREVLARIKEQLKKETPRGRGYAAFLSGAKATALIVLVIVSMLTLSLFVSDIVEKFQGGEFENQSFYQNIPAFVFGLLLISILAVGAIYVIYRNTDWPFVKNRLGILVTAFIFIVLLSAGTVYLSETETTALGDFLDGTKDKIEESLSLPTWLDSEDGESLHMIEGTITNITSDGRDWIIVIDAGIEIQTLTLERRFGAFVVGDKVQVVYEIDGESRDVETIKKI